MSTVHQTQINVLTQQKLELVLDAIQKLNKNYALLTKTRDEHDERIERLELNASSARANDDPKSQYLRDNTTEPGMRPERIDGKHHTLEKPE